MKKWISAAKVEWARTPTINVENCDQCNQEIVWTPSGEAKNASDPNGYTHCCPMDAQWNVIRS